MRQSALLEGLLLTVCLPPHLQRTLKLQVRRPPRVVAVSCIFFISFDLAFLSVFDDVSAYATKSSPFYRKGHIPL